MVPASIARQQTRRAEAMDRLRRWTVAVVLATTGAAGLFAVLAAAGLPGRSDAQAAGSTSSPEGQPAQGGQHQQGFDSQSGAQSQQNGGFQQSGFGGFSQQSGGFLGSGGGGGGWAVSGGS